MEPSTGATTIVIDQSASARREAGKMSIRRLCESGINGPAAAPCRMRQAMSMPSESERPHKSDARTKSAVQKETSLVAPTVIASHPEVGMITALATP